MPNPPLRYALLTLLLLTATASPAADINRELEDIANRLATKIEATDKTSIAVTDLTDLQGEVHQFGRFISEEISTNLVLSGRQFNVIDRNHLRTILKEQKLSMSGLMDPKNQKKLGKILGVDALVLGSITSFGESYRVTFKLVATDTARVIAADRGSIPKTPATNELWDTIIDDDALLSSASGSTSRGASRTSRSAKKGVFRNQFLEIAIESVALRKDKKSLTLVVRLTNLTKHDLYIAESPSSSIIDDTGVTWQRNDLTGLTVFNSTANNFRSGSNYDPDQYLSLMTAGQSQPVNYTFQTRSKAGDAKRLSFSTSIYVKVPKDGKDDEWRYLTIGIGLSGIELR